MKYKAHEPYRPYPTAITRENFQEAIGALAVATTRPPVKPSKDWTAGAERSEDLFIATMKLGEFARDIGNRLVAAVKPALVRSWEATDTTDQRAQVRLADNLTIAPTVVTSRNLRILPTQTITNQPLATAIAPPIENESSLAGLELTPIGTDTVTPTNVPTVPVLDGQRRVRFDPTGVDPRVIAGIVSF